MKITLATLVCLILTGMAGAQPATLAPVLKFVVRTDPAKGHIALVETVYKTVPVFVQKVVIENGKQVTVNVPEYRIIPETLTVTVDVAKSRIFTAGGKQLPIEELWKRVKAKTVVAVSSDSTMPDEAFLRALNAETIVIIPGNEAKKIAPPK